MEKYLTPNEKIVYEAKIHWISNFYPAILTIIGFVPVFLMSFMLKEIWNFQLNTLTFTALIYLAILLFFVKILWNGLSVWIGNRKTKIFVTNKRIILRTGIFGTNIDDMLISKSDAVSFSQTFLGQRLNFGRVEIKTIGETVFSFNIENPMGLRTAINEQIDNQNNINNVNMVFPTISGTEIHPELRKLINEQLSM